MKRSIAMSAVIAALAVAVNTTNAADDPGPELVQAEKDARKTLDDFFAAFNTADNDALQNYMNYPHVFVGANGSIRTIDDRFDIDFDRMREQEDWKRSTLDSARAFLVKTDKVHFELTFTRYNTNDEPYRTVSGLWIVTKQDEKWGLSLRSY